MITVCDGCGVLFLDKKVTLNVKQIKFNVCKKTLDESYECLDAACPYFIDEDDNVGCTEFYFCPVCSKKKNVIRSKLKEFEKNCK